MNKVINATSKESLSKMIEFLSPGQKTKITQATAEFIRDSGMYTGEKFRNMQMWTNEFEFAIGVDLYTLIWPDNNMGIMIQAGSSF